MKTFSIRISFFKAALIIAAKKDIRYYLNGVLIDIMPGEYRIVSTDGHRLGCFRVECEDLDDAKPAQIIIPREVVEAIKPASRHVECCTLTYDPDAPMGRSIIAGVKGPELAFAPVDAKYPDYLRVLPNSAPSGTFGDGEEFNADYVADFAHMRRVACGKYLNGNAAIYPNGTDCAPVLFPGCPEFYGALMPMRGGMPAWECPNWITPAQTQKAA